LDKNRQQILTELTPYVEDMVMGGGTALALQINHRKSFDFDFFTKHPIENRLRERIQRKIPVGIVSVDTEDELTFFDKNNIKVTFLYYPFDHVDAPFKSELGFNLFTIRDIAIQKAYTIGRRAVYRDYFDIFTILSGKYISFNELVEITARIYGSSFNLKSFLQQLVYFEDLQNYEIIQIDDSTPVTDFLEVKRYIQDLVTSYLKTSVK